MRPAPSVLRLSLLSLLIAGATACTGPASSDEDDEGAAAATARRTEDDPGIDLSSSGDLVIAREALGTRVFRLAGTAIYAKWDEGNCGPRPADLRDEPPGDMPDTCFYKILTLLTRHVVFSLEGETIVMKEGQEELGRFTTTTQKEGSVTFRFDPSVIHVKIALAQDRPPVAVPIRDGRVTARKRAGWVALTQEGMMMQPGGAPPVPVRVKYGLRERRVNDSFTPTFQRDGSKKHLYEINHADRPVAKFDFTRDQTVTFRSVGLPAEHRAVADDALRGAIDYWNRVFREASGQRDRVFFAAETAEPGVFAHDPGFNVLQWSTYEKNSASMGLFQTDGVTGEILFSNGYISAGFFDAARKVGSKMRDHVGARASATTAVAQFTSDYILETIAHEIGHMVGLQHNFHASTVGASRTPEDFAPLARDYFDTGHTPPDLSTSVMEYLPIPLAGMLGRRMRTELLAHDVAAVTRAYFGRSSARPDDASLPYCNETEEGAPGCAQFDHALCAQALSSYCFTSTL